MNKINKFKAYLTQFHLFLLHVNVKRYKNDKKRNQKDNNKNNKKPNQKKPNQNSQIYWSLSDKKLAKMFFQN